VHPPLDFEGYRSTALRHPKQPLVLLEHRLTEVTGPLLGDQLIVPTDSDLTTQHDGEPQGQRIIVTGRVLDSDGRPVPDTLIEIWQTNAAGRYRHGASITRRRSTRTSTASGAPSPTPVAGTGSSPSSPAPTRGATTTTPGARRTFTSRCSAGRSRSGWSPRCTSLATRCCRSTRSSTRSPTRRPGSG
jgi:hypothetical protein